MRNLVDISLLLGAISILLAAMGAVKFPDTLTRIAGVTKASTLGAVCFCIAGAIHFAEMGLSLLLLISAIILALGIPISSHLISRARIHDRHPMYLKRNDHQEDQM